MNSNYVHTSKAPTESHLEYNSEKDSIKTTD
jgi:hypothetical protein